jgi:hypothetical protein
VCLSLLFLQFFYQQTNAEPYFFRGLRQTLVESEKIVNVSHGNKNRQQFVLCYVFAVAPLV